MAVETTIEATVAGGTETRTEIRRANISSVNAIEVTYTTTEDFVLYDGALFPLVLSSIATSIGYDGTAYNELDMSTLEVPLHTTRGASGASMPATTFQVAKRYLSDIDRCRWKEFWSPISYPGEDLNNVVWVVAETTTPGVDMDISHLQKTGHWDNETWTESADSEYDEYGRPVSVITHISRYSGRCRTHYKRNVSSSYDYTSPLTHEVGTGADCEEDLELVEWQIVPADPSSSGSGSTSQSTSPSIS